MKLKIIALLILFCSCQKNKEFRNILIGDWNLVKETAQFPDTFYVFDYQPPYKMVNFNGTEYYSYFYLTKGKYWVEGTNTLYLNWDNGTKMKILSYSPTEFHGQFSIAISDSISVTEEQFYEKVQ